MVARKTGSETSKEIASLAGKALKDPKSITPKQIQKLAGSVLDQREPPTIPLKPRSKKR